MTRIFTDEGNCVPVTVIEVMDNFVTQAKTLEKDGYTAVQVTTGSGHRNRIRKAEAGIFKKAHIDGGVSFWEFRLDRVDGEFSPGQQLPINIFRSGQLVDVAGTSIGKGFAGTIKRHNFSSGDATHGNSLSHRTPGSTGQRKTPGKVIKGKRMPGHMGNARRTARNLTVMKVDTERRLLIVKGCVPGSRGGHVLISPSKKTATSSD
jgi:large subunit ribosomal protein L3